MTSYSFDSAGAALVDMKQRRRGLKSAGTMSGSSEAGTFVNDIPDYEQGLDFETCDWLDDAENEHDIGEGWDGVMQQHRLSAAGARGDSRASYQDENTEFDKTLTYKDVHVFTKSQAAALELKRNNSRAGLPPPLPFAPWFFVTLHQARRASSARAPLGAASPCWIPYICPSRRGREVPQRCSIQCAATHTLPCRL